MGKDIVIVDYGMGNLFSNRKLIERLGFSCSVSADADAILNAGKLILPGVGHFGKAMQNLHAKQLVTVLNEAVLNRKIPVLGICLGMQLMAESSEEGEAQGLGWFAGARVVKFRIQDRTRFKVPHVGWNNAFHEKPSILLSGIEDESEFYFVHSYHVETSEKQDVLCRTSYEYSFVSAIEKENIMGVQFHPEKSHGAGEQMIRNFINQ